MTLPINRVNYCLGLLLLALFAVSVVLTLGSSCDECCTAGTCTDCQDCHCASTTCFVLQTFAGAEFHVEVSGHDDALSQILPDRDWCSDLYRPPRLLCI